MKILYYLSILILTGSGLFAQSFTRITDAGNPIVSDILSSPGTYSGASWVDYDGDDDIDLFINNDVLYRNDGAGIFVRVTGSGLGGGQSTQGIGHGQSWADIDNDGDLDCFISGRFGFLYVNNGDGSFSQITSGDIGGGNDNRGWACAFGDIDNDSYVDLVITHPAGFIPGGSALPNHLFMNNGDGTFRRIAANASDVTTGLDPYTVGTFADFDDDGDQDLFIGSGPASGSPAPDNLYRNLLAESGTATLQKITSGILATDPVDGQVWNWIDYDLDGDLDGFLTNYAATVNNLYRNDNGTFVKMTAAQVGSIVSDAAFSLANIWVDFDNDGDEDCYITNDGNTQAFFYVNNGDGTFTRDSNTAPATISAPQCGASAGDYDRDGDMDLFVFSPVNTSRALFRNDAESNGNHWVNINCVGTTANRAAIGATVRAKATINGNAVWQRRMVSAQNSFNCQNSLNIHFGFADALVIDSLEILWPGGARDVYTNVAVDDFYQAVEGMGLNSLTPIAPATGLPGEFLLKANYPNPFNPKTDIRYQVADSRLVNLGVYDVLGRRVRTLVEGEKTIGSYTVTWDGRNDLGQEMPSGTYLLRMVAGEFTATRKMMLIK